MGDQNVTIKNTSDIRLMDDFMPMRVAVDDGGRKSITFKQWGAKYGETEFGTTYVITDSNKNNVFDEADTISEYRHGQTLYGECVTSKDELRRKKSDSSSGNRFEGARRRLLRPYDKDSSGEQCKSLVKKYSASEMKAFFSRVSARDKKIVSTLFSIKPATFADVLKDRPVPAPKNFRGSVDAGGCKGFLDMEMNFIKKLPGGMEVIENIRIYPYSSNVPNTVLYRLIFRCTKRDNRITLGIMRAPIKDFLFSAKLKAFLKERSARLCESQRWMALKSPVIPRLSKKWFNCYPFIQNNIFPFIDGLNLHAAAEYVSSWSRDGSGQRQRIDGSGATLGVELMIDPWYNRHRSESRLVNWIPYLGLTAGTGIGAVMPTSNGKKVTRLELKPFLGTNIHFLLNVPSHSVWSALALKVGLQRSHRKNEEGEYDVRSGFFSGASIKLRIRPLLRIFDPEIGAGYTFFHRAGKLPRRHDLSTWIGLNY